MHYRFCCRYSAFLKKYKGVYQLWKGMWKMKGIRVQVCVHGALCFKGYGVKKQVDLMHTRPYPPSAFSQLWGWGQRPNAPSPSSSWYSQIHFWNKTGDDSLGLLFPTQECIKWKHIYTNIHTFKSVSMKHIYMTLGQRTSQITVAIKNSMDST